MFLSFAECSSDHCCCSGGSIGIHRYIPPSACRRGSYPSFPRWWPHRPRRPRTAATGAVPQMAAQTSPWRQVWKCFFLNNASVQRYHIPKLRRIWFLLVLYYYLQLTLDYINSCGFESATENFLQLTDTAGQCPWLFSGDQALLSRYYWEFLVWTWILIIVRRLQFIYLHSFAPTLSKQSGE